jgi:hypothetical protein
MPEGTLHIGPDEVRALLAFSRRQFLWDMRMPVRVVSTASAIGLYTAPPLGVLALFAVPGTIDIPSEDPLDVTVTLSSLVSELESASASARDIDLERLHPASVPVTSAMSVAFLPPSEGWQVPMHAVAGDLGLRVDEAVAEFTSRSAGQGEAVQQQIADEIWERTVWAALPMRVLHAAKRLGMLGNDRSRVSAASCGTWKRFSTSRGHVFIRPAPTPTRTALRLLF